MSDASERRAEIFAEATRLGIDYLAILDADKGVDGVEREIARVKAAGPATGIGLSTGTRFTGADGRTYIAAGNELGPDHPDVRWPDALRGDWTKDPSTGAWGLEAGAAARHSEKSEDWASKAGPLVALGGIGLTAAPAILGAGATTGSGGAAATLPESYWSATAGGVTSDAAPAAAGTLGGGTYSTGFAGANPGFTLASEAAAPTLGSTIAPAAAGAGAGAGILGSLNLGTIGSIAAGATGLAALAGGKSSTQTSTTNVPPQTAEERALTAINADLAKRQLANIDSLQPFQQELLMMSLENMRRDQALSKAMDTAIPPEQQAALAKSEFERAQRLGPMQDELMQIQLDQLRRNGAATPEQIASIREATDAGIAAGTGDIDLQTQRGIGLISDELANSRGLRLTDTPILREATLLTRAGEDQKAGLIRNLRASEATARLNYPLSVQQVQSGIALGQQNLADSAQKFQAELRNRAYQNRLALTGQTSSAGIGLASIGGGNGALNALTQSRLAGAPTTVSNSSSGIGLGEAGQLLSGAAAIGKYWG